MKCVLLAMGKSGVMTGAQRMSTGPFLALLWLIHWQENFETVFVVEDKRYNYLFNTGKDRLSTAYSKMRKDL